MPQAGGWRLAAGLIIAAPLTQRAPQVPFVIEAFDRGIHPVDDVPADYRDALIGDAGQVRQSRAASLDAVSGFALQAYRLIYPPTTPEIQRFGPALETVLARLAI